MKKNFLKNYYGFILMIIGIFSVAFVNAQTCKGNKVWACRTCQGIYGTTYQECDCVDANKVAIWQASPCIKYHTNNGGGNNGGGPCICAIAHKGTGIEETSDGIYPNPVINSTTIHVTLPEKQKISLKVFDLNGKLITPLADGSFEAGEHQMEWNAATVNAGIYILRLQTLESIQTRKLIVIK